MAASLIEQLVDLAGTGIGGDERPLGAARINYNGSSAVRKATLEAELASVTSELGLDGPASDAGIDPDTLVAFPAASQMAILVTDKRLVLWALGFTGKPGKLIGTVPVRGIAEVHRGEISFGSLVRVVMKSGAAVDLEVKKGDDVDAFTTALETAVSGGHAG